MVKFNDTIYNNGTLKNKLNIKSQAKLDNRIYPIVSKRSILLLENPIKINKIKILKDINWYLFSPFFFWAGCFRTYMMQENKYKGSDYSSDWFQSPRNFGISCHYINRLINHINSISKPVAKDYAKSLSCIDFLHPFRDGNTRTEKVFLQLLAINLA